MFIISKYNIGFVQAIDISEVKSIGIIFFSSVLSLVRVHQSRSKSPKFLKSVDGDANPSKQTLKQATTTCNSMFAHLLNMTMEIMDLPVLCLLGSNYTKCSMMC